MLQKLPQDEFLRTFEKVPRVALNLLIKDQEGSVLLTKRAIPPQEGMWHFPGSFLLKGEKLAECLRRIAKDEFGHELIEKPTLTGVFENMDEDSRGHIVDIIYTVTLDHQLPLVTTPETAEAQYFVNLPEHMGFNHKNILQQLGYV